MEGNRSPATEDIISLTLEIVHLLTGEDYGVVRKSGESAVVPGSHQPAGNDKKVLEVSNKIIHLLTGEVWRFLGHAALYNDLTGERHHTAAPLDPSMFIQPEATTNEIKEEVRSGRERPLPQNDHLIPEEDVIGEDPISCERLPFPSGDICADYTQSEDTSDEKEVATSQDEDNSNPRNHDRHADFNHIKDESVAEDSFDGGDVENHFEEEPFLSPGCKTENDDFTDDSSTENPMTTNLREGPHCVERVADLSTPREPTSEVSNTVTQEVHHGRSQDPSSPSKSPGRNNIHPHYDSDISVKQTQQILVIERPFACPECGKRFAQKPDLEEHQKIHTIERPFPCSECWRSFCHKSDLVRHCRTHTGERPFTCSVCGKCFAQKSVLNQHHRVHNGERPFPCDYCGRCFSQKSILTKHLRTHTGERPFPCTECGKSFSRKYILVAHQRFHSQEKPFPCPECGKYFRHKSHLAEHRKIHTGEKPFPCSECGKCFRFKSDLVRHLRVHSGLRPYPCPECGKCFKHRSDLTIHQRIHRDVKPFPCMTCGKTFAQKANLLNHQRTHSH